MRELGNALQKDLESVDPEMFYTALAADLIARNQQFLTGIEKYRAHPYQRKLEPPPPLWECGPVQLQDFGATHPSANRGKPILVIPSLVNRSYIMDLTAERSFLRYLASTGLRPLLVDWGTPGQRELAQNLDHCVDHILRQALAIATETSRDQSVPVMGYCMGGTLATALAFLEPEKCNALILLATPWDFHVDTNGPPPIVNMGRAVLEQIISTKGNLPVDAIQTMFFSLDPLLGWDKFRSFAELDMSSSEAKIFVALEDWLNDGVPLAGEIARTCLFDWYGRNSPARGEWRVTGRRIDPSTLKIPTLGVSPTNDRIVPPASASSLIDQIPCSKKLTLTAGHIGMMVGGRARKTLWEPIATWIKSI